MATIESAIGSECKERNPFCSLRHHWLRPLQSSSLCNVDAGTETVSCGSDLLCSYQAASITRRGAVAGDPAECLTVPHSVLSPPFCFGRLPRAGHVEACV